MAVAGVKRIFDSVCRNLLLQLANPKSWSLPTKTGRSGLLMWLYLGVVGGWVGG